jgi:putative DNA methylase
LSTTITYPKRLIEVDLPIKRISAHARREKSIRHGHISTLHIWWARRPLAACRAVICAALWPDPADSLCPQDFRDEAASLIINFAKKAITDKNLADHCSSENIKKWNKLSKLEGGIDTTNETHLKVLREALLDFIADFANWDNSTQKDYLETSRALTQIAHEALGGIPGIKPLVVDPFAGGGSIPLEALRVGADAFASDLNPVAVLINKVVLEYIPKYGQKLADEVRKWGNWVKDQAEKELAEFYPKDPDGATPIAYLWARTITCEGPGCGIELPLIRSLWLAKKGNRSVALQIIPKPEAKRVDFGIIERRNGEWVKANDSKSTIKNPEFDGTVRRGSATCPCCGYTTPIASVRRQLKERHGGASDARLFCVVTTKLDRPGRFYRLPNPMDLEATQKATQELAKRIQEHKGTLSLIPDESTSDYDTFVNRGPIYGLTTWADYFNSRQALALSTVIRLIQEIEKYSTDKEKGSLSTAIQTCLALAVDRLADKNASLSVWNNIGEKIEHVFGRQAIPMVWDYVEVGIFSESTGNWISHIDLISKCIECDNRIFESAQVECANATQHPLPNDIAHMFCTDPPYYYSVQYADLSDFFYVWLKRSLGERHNDLFKPMLTPKEDEIIVQSPNCEFASGGKNRKFYESRMRIAMSEGRRILAPYGIGIVVFAHTSTAGWESLLQALVESGWIITGSWPIDTERAGRLLSIDRAVLASSIHLVCRPRENPDGSLRTDDIGDWRDVLQELPKRIHEWIVRLASEGVVGADAIFACLGPALEIFSRYSRVEKASGEQVTLKEYPEYVWAAVAKEALSMIFEGADATGFEEDARLTAMWLWTLSTGTANGNRGDDGGEDSHDEEDEEKAGKSPKTSGYVLEFDAARKIAQGLGAHLENLRSLVEIKGDKTRLLPVSERAKFLFGKDEASTPQRRKKQTQQEFEFLKVLRESEEEYPAGWGGKSAMRIGNTVLDQLHQAMLLFGAGRGEALKRFLVEQGVGKDQRFWKLAQAFSALYPLHSDEKRWVDGVLARKKGLGF